MKMACLVSKYNLIIISTVTILYRLVAFSKSWIQKTKTSSIKQRSWKGAMTMKQNKKKKLFQIWEKIIKSILLIKIILMAIWSSSHFKTRLHNSRTINRCASKEFDSCSQVIPCQFKWNTWINQIMPCFSSIKTRCKDWCSSINKKERKCKRKSISSKESTSYLVRHLVLHNLKWVTLLVVMLSKQSKKLEREHLHLKTLATIHIWTAQVWSIAYS